MAPDEVCEAARRMQQEDWERREGRVCDEEDLQGGEGVHGCPGFWGVAVVVGDGDWVRGGRSGRVEEEDDGAVSAGGQVCEADEARLRRVACGWAEVWGVEEDEAE